MHLGRCRRESILRTRSPPARLVLRTGVELANVDVPAFACRLLDVASLFDARPANTASTANTLLATPALTGPSRRWRLRVLPRRPGPTMSCR